MTATTEQATVTEAQWELFGQVRRLKEHDDTRGGYVPVVIGWWDRRGYTHCLECPPETLERDDRGYPDRIYCDNSAVIDADRCDYCASSLMSAALERFGPLQRNL